MSPDRPNIFYEAKVRTDIDTDFRDLVASLRENMVSTPRVCQSLNMCSELFAHFLYELGEMSRLKSVTIGHLACFMPTLHNTIKM